MRYIDYVVIEGWKHESKNGKEFGVMDNTISCGKIWEKGGRWKWDS